jgi:acyl-CoA thioesterase-2
MKLEAILTLDAVDDYTFQGHSRPGTETRIFGGEVAGQAVMAAGRTVPADRPIHSAACTYLRPGDPAAPVMYRVDPLRDGRSFTTRRVEAVQHGKVIFQMTASFQVDEPGLHHQAPALSATPAPDLPTPEEQLSADPAALAWCAHIRSWIPADFRFPDPTRTFNRGTDPLPPHQQAWITAADALPDDPLLHAGALTYLSDMFLLSTSLKPHGVSFGTAGMQFATLTHTVYFHAPTRADGWLLYDQESPWTGRARALCRGSLFAADGELVASTVQEGLVRLP